MATTPIKNRPFDLFVSYSHDDHPFVSGLVKWLQANAGVSVWWDETQLGSGDPITYALPDGLKQAKAAAFVVSKSAVESSWIREELGAAMQQQRECTDFLILGLRVDESPIPDFLLNRKLVELRGGELDADSAVNTLSGLYSGDFSSSPRNARDVYVSRTWRQTEAAAPDEICKRFMASGYRLIGDSKDQGVFDKDERIPAIMASCGAALVIATDRKGSGKTSPWIEDEIRIAMGIGIPCLLLKDESVELAGDLVSGALEGRAYSIQQMLSSPPYALEVLDEFDEHYRLPSTPHYAFYAGSLTKDRSTSRRVRRIVEMVTGMECIVGADLQGQHAQREIIERIRGALFVLADITDDNKNTLIEAGIARGAGTRLHLLTKGDPAPTRFMFRDLEVAFFNNEVELLGAVHRIARPYRRRVLNREFGLSKRP